MDRQVQWLTGLQQVTGLVASRVSLEDLYLLIFEQVARILPVTGFWIGLYNAKENRLIRVLSVEAQGGRYRFQGGEAEEEISGTIWERALRMREPILINRRLSDVPTPVAREEKDGGTRRRPSSVMFVPMLVGEQVVGVMSAESSTPSAYDEEALDMLNTVANQAALAIENARLLDRLNRQIVETNKANRLKTQFLANISHEVRTPLNAILGFTRILKRHGDGNLPPDQMENVDRILESAEHLIQLIEDLLDLSRLEVGRMTLVPDAVDVRRLVARVVAEMEPLLQDTENAVEAEFGPDALTVVTDATRVRQILMNLLSNAMKFTRSGRIVVRMGRPSSVVPEESGWQYFGPIGEGIPSDRALEAGLAETVGSGPYFFLEVSDTGVGMNAEVVAELFGEFRQGSVGDSRLYGGTGLGLSIVQRIAGLMRGIIWVKTSPGKGSTFRVLLQELLARPPSPPMAGRETGEKESGDEPTNYPAR
jgi:signal transduction histidine kinase